MLPKRLRLPPGRQFLIAAVVSSCFFLAACSQRTLLHKLVPPESEAAARSYFDQLCHGQFDGIERDLDPSISRTDAWEVFTNMAALCPLQDPVSITVVGVHITRNADSRTVDLSLQYEFPNKRLLFNIVTRKHENTTVITSLHITPMNDSLENLNKFSLAHKAPAQYAFLLAGATVVCFTFYTLVLCATTRHLNRKWLWLLFILVGFVRFAVNWTTGDFSWSLFSLNIPPVIAGQPLYGAWTIAVYVPIGAVLFLNHRWKMRVQGDLIDPPAPAQNPSP